LDNVTKHITKVNSFLELLKTKGFAIGIQTYKDVHHVLYQHITAAPQNGYASFKPFFAALVSKSDEQQELFSILYDDYFSSEISTATGVNDHEPHHSWWEKKYAKIGVGITVLAALAILLINYFSAPVSPVFSKKFIAQPYFYCGDTHAFCWDSLVQNRKSVKGISFKAMLQDKIVEDTVLHFQKPGKQRLLITVQRPEAKDTVLPYSLYIAHKKHLTIRPGHADVVINDTVSYSSPVDTTIHYKPYWIVDKDTVPYSVHNDSTYITTRFSKGGDYTIKTGYNVAGDTLLSQFPEQYYSTTFTQSVTPEFQVDVIEENVLPIIQTYIYTLYIILGLIALLILIAVLFVLRKRNKAMAAEQPDESYHGTEGEYELQFNSREKSISTGKDIRRVARELRKQIETNISVLDLKQTVYRTVKKNGMLTLSSKNKQRQQSFLLLVNSEYINSQQLQLFRFLAKYLVDQKVVLDFYFYYQNPGQFYTATNSSPYTLQQIEDNHHNSQVIVFSKGYEFLNPAGNGINSRYTDIFSQSDTRVLVTPYSQDDWSYRETALHSFFSIVPADIEGLLSLVQLLNNDISLSQINNLAGQYATKYVDFNDSNALKDYLDPDKNDDSFFQWVCALACFPRLDWNVTLAIGALISPQNLNYTSLLRLVRIEWMHKGAIGSAMRFSLLKALKPDNEIAVRKLLLELIEEDSTDEKRFSYEEKRVIQISNNFMLYAAGEKKDEAAKRDHDIFVKRYKDDSILDASLIRYLEKKQEDGEVWQTPLNAPIGGYLKNYDKSKNYYNRLLAVCGVLFCLLTGLLIITGPVQEEAVQGWYDVHTITYPDAAITFNENECSAYLSKKYPGEQLKITVEKEPGDSLAYADDSSQIIKKGLKIPVTSNVKAFTISGVLPGGSINDHIRIAAGKKYAITIKGRNCKDNDETQLTVNATPPTADIPENIPVNIKIWPGNSVNQSLLAALKEQYNVNIIVGFPVSKNRVVYHDDIYKTQAEKIAQITTTILKEDITVIKANGNTKAIELELKGEQKIVTCEPEIDAGIYRIYFEKDKSNISQTNANVFDKIIKEISSYPDYILTINAFAISASSKETSAYDLKIAERQYNSVVQYFISKGIKADKIRGKSGVRLIYTSPCSGVVEIDAMDVDTGVTPEPEPVATPQPSYKILWLDDNPGNNKSVITYLQNNKIQVEIVTTNAQATRLAQQTDYDLIITDISRDHDEKGVPDKYTAGIEFVKGIKYPKDRVLICSTGLDEYRVILNKEGFTKLYNDFNELQEYIMSYYKARQASPKR
jgi:outer membrane protein OmpA-like peptidoglycan-associated protein